MFLGLRQTMSLGWFSTFDILRFSVIRAKAPMVLYAVTLLAIWHPPDSVSAGQAIQVKSCDFSAIQAAVKAAVPGDVVHIPAGTCDWGSSMLIVPGGISLKGAGLANTVIRASFGTGDLITFDCSNGKTSTFSDMTLIGKGNPTIWDGGLTFLNGCNDFSVFNSKFMNFVNHGISVEGNSRGVIFKNEFLNNFRAGQTGGTTGYAVVVYGDGTWPPLELGTGNAVFVEDNYFYGNRHNIASNNGSRYVFRHNTVTATEAVKNFSMVDAHGLTSSPQGSRSWEVYNNTFSTKLLTSNAARTTIGIGGGDGVIFNNVLTNPDTISKTIELWPPRQPTPYPAIEQMTAGYFWNNSPNIIGNGAPANFVEGRDYFLYPKPGYTPYTYPHPLRPAQPAAQLAAPTDLRVQ